MKLLRPKSPRKTALVDADANAVESAEETAAQPSSKKIPLLSRFRKKKITPVAESIENREDVAPVREQESIREVDDENLYYDDDHDFLVSSRDWFGLDEDAAVAITVVTEKEQNEMDSPKKKTKKLPKPTANDLWTACKIGDKKFVKNAIDFDARLVHLPQDGRTPLYYAAHCGHAKIVRLLLAAGAQDVDGTAELSALNASCRQLLRDYREHRAKHPPVEETVFLLQRLAGVDDEKKATDLVLPPAWAMAPGDEGLEVVSIPSSIPIVRATSRAVEVVDLDISGGRGEDMSESERNFLDKYSPAGGLEESDEDTDTTTNSSDQSRTTGTGTYGTYEDRSTLGGESTQPDDLSSEGSYDYDDDVSVQSEGSYLVATLVRDLLVPCGAR